MKFRVDWYIIRLYLQKSKFGLIQQVAKKYLLQGSTWFSSVWSMIIRYVPLFGPKKGNNYENIQERPGFYLWGSKSVQNSCPALSKNGFYRVMSVLILSLSLVKDFPVKRFSFFESYYGFQTFRSCEYVRGRLTHQSLKSNIKFQKLKE